MKRKNNRRGFTMAELLIVVAIIGILSGVGFVAVQLHQKSLAQLEANSIAKEIFIAAQNHLTMAESQGYLGENVDYGTGTSYTTGEGTAAVTISENVYYVAVKGSGAFTATSILNQMLPFGAIDETVRAGGNYVIRYQANPARVLDVWYGKPNNESFKGGYTGNPTTLAMNGLVREMNHNYGNNNVIGWYGGDEALTAGVVLQAPSITVENAERLTVTVDMTRVLESAAALADQSKVSVKLIIEGETSGAMAAIPILPSQNHRVTEPNALDDTEYVVTLDDITQAYDSTYNDGLHFAEINNGPGATATKIDLANGTAFIPGENITVSAVTFDNAELASIEYSNEVTTNSLFADVVDASDAGVAGVTSGKVALISNIRHLENLDKRVSGLNASSLSIAAAEQTVDLSWLAFDAAIVQAKSTVYNATDKRIIVYGIYKNGASATSSEGCFLPVNISYPLVYDGGIEPAVAASEDREAAAARYHTITGVKVSTTATGDHAGLFGTLDATNGAVTIRNLELLDFDITGAGSAGALAGKAQGAEGKYVTIRNVLAHNSSEYDTDKDLTVTVKSNGGNAGGLVGEMTFCNMTNCAAALVVSSTSKLEDASNNAGGLVGKASGNITGCYSGGHTNDGAYSSETYNVTSDRGAAGGLVGDAGGSHIKFSYSTCSASGKTAGGLVGKSTVNTGKIDVSYATGLVSQQEGGTAGAFAGSYSGTMTGCLYLEIINEKKDSSPLEYLQPVGNVTSATGVTAIDASASSYNEFSGSPATDWQTASPYDETLATLYQNMYNLKSIDRLETGATGLSDADKVKTTATTTIGTTTTTTPADFVATHYGDWPAPEILVINTKN